MKQRIYDGLRVSDMLAVFLVLAIVVAMVAPQQLGILAYKGALLAGAVFGGYWADRRLFPYSRPHEFYSSIHSEYRRAVIVAACVLAVGLAA